MLVTGGLNDPRVSYWEPAKWVAKLRATKTDDHLLLLKTEMGAGHAGPSGRYDAWRDEAFVLSFVLDQLGIEKKPHIPATTSEPGQRIVTGPEARPRRFRDQRERSDGADVLRLVTLTPGADVELDTLTLFERLVARPLDRREVDENVVTLLPGDEAETLLRVEKLHSACSQRISFVRRDGPNDAASVAKSVADGLLDPAAPCR